MDSEALTFFVKSILHKSGTKISGTEAERKEESKRRGREAAWFKLYGLTADNYYGLLKSQGGLCAICKQPEKAKNRKFLSVDHCHKTGKVRSLLCAKCNFLVGVYERVFEPRGILEYVASHRKPDTCAVENKKFSA